MKKSILILGLTLIVSSQIPSAMAKNESRLWVVVDRTERHTCPSSKCGVAGKLFFREGVDFLEKKGEWVRITEPYSASCVEGKANILKKVINPAQEKTESSMASFQNGLNLVILAVKGHQILLKMRAEMIL
ncbi:hypothetical protein O5171_08800 [Escherichia coli]|nr:hypothetical protein [Escherichia coli]